MDKYDFRTEEGLKINLVEHTLEQIQKWPNLKIYVGTDSQNYSGITRYITAVVFRYGKTGAHYVYSKDELPRVKGEYNRLYGEGTRSIEAAEILTKDIPVAVEAIEFDYADAKKTISTQLVSTFKGWVGFKAVFKSGQMMACKAADHICRREHTDQIV